VPIRTISSRVIEDAAVVAADIAAGTITQDKLSANSFDKNIFDSSTLISLQNDSIILDGTDGASANAGDNIVFDTAADVNDRVLINEAKNPDSAPGVYESALFHIVNEQATATGGGGSTTLNFIKIPYNTVKTNEITGASLSSNQITLPSGSYYVSANTVLYRTNESKIFLRNVTDSTYDLIGHPMFVSQGDSASGTVHIDGRITISSQKVFEIQVWTQRTQANGFGYGSGITDGQASVFASLKIWKID